MNSRSLSLACLALAAVGVLFERSAVADDENSAAVRAAVDEFYEAINAVFAGEMGPMNKVWSHADDITYLGPDGAIRIGWKQVQADWQKQAGMKLGGKIAPEDLHIIVGRDLAIVSNFEVGQNTVDGKTQQVRIRATSTFRNEDGTWKMIGHHTDKLPFIKQ